MNEDQSTLHQQEEIERFMVRVGNDPVKLVESIFRVRNNKGILKDYIVAEPHKQLFRHGYLGDRTELYRIIDKGRQLGFSILQAIESTLMATRHPSTHQYYIATKEGQAKSWLRKVERISKDARLWVDGSRIIDIDTVHSSLLEKAFRHLPNETRREIETSYITGLAASPAGAQGETAINVILDEFGWMIQRKNQQSDIYEAVKYFVSQGGQLTIQSTPVVSSDFFWKMYKDAENLGFTSYYFPTITNWESLDLSKDLRTQNCNIPYPWADINVLEKARRNDVAFFKQMNLGVPADVMHRFLNPDLLHSRTLAEEEYYGGSNEAYGIAVDVAQDRDITAITVVKNVNGVISEVYIDDSQADYRKQAKKIVTIANRYPNLRWIAIDTTNGDGKGIHDNLKYEIAVPLKKMVFSTTVKVPGYEKKERLHNVLATEFHKALINNKYHMIKHPQAMQHCLNVEKIATESGGIRYSGKKNGRDDHFWSKAMANYCFLNTSKGDAVSAYGSKNGFQQQHYVHNATENTGFLTF